MSTRAQCRFGECPALVAGVLVVLNVLIVVLLVVLNAPEHDRMEE
jgi:hypothetical protein